MPGDKAPRFGDTNNILFRKILWSFNVESGVSTDNEFLFKICEQVNLQSGGQNPPQFGDSNNNLLFKIARSLSLT